MDRELIRPDAKAVVWLGIGVAGTLGTQAIIKKYRKGHPEKHAQPSPARMVVPKAALVANVPATSVTEPSQQGNPVGEGKERKLGQHLTPEQEAKVKVMIRSGQYSAQEIATEVGTSPKTVYSWSKKLCKQSGIQYKFKPRANKFTTKIKHNEENLLQ